VFDDYATAQNVVEELTHSGFSRNDIQIMSHQEYAKSVGGGNAGLSGQPGDRSGGGIAGFFRRLFGDDVDDKDRGYFAEAVRRGGCVVSVNAGDATQERAAEIMEAHDAIDIDRRAEQWKQSGFKSFDDSAPAYTDEEIAREREHYREGREAYREDEKRSMPVVNEEIEVGKRTVRRGGVRVYNRVHEEPVEETVRLREEHVRVDRRPANRPATDADIRAHDEVIEVTEFAEEPVIGKRARVVEEVVVGKETTERTEKVRDSVRRSDVNVEKIPAGEGDSRYEDYTSDFRHHFDSRYGGRGDVRFETYEPAYQYGYRMASDGRYKGKRWEDVESDFRADYERQYPNSTWEQIKDSVRYGWDKVTRKR
jgi:uncharacterized protein (TIGR02271 family)